MPSQRELVEKELVERAERLMLRLPEVDGVYKLDRFLISTNWNGISIALWSGAIGKTSIFFTEGQCEPWGERYMSLVVGMLLELRQLMLLDDLANV